MLEKVLLHAFDGLSQYGEQYGNQSGRLDHQSSHTRDQTLKEWLEEVPHYTAKDIGTISMQTIANLGPFNTMKLFLEPRYSYMLTFKGLVLS